MSNAKDIPNAEMKEAFKAMNLYLELDKRKKLKYVGVKQAVALPMLQKAIEGEIDAKKSKGLPEVVIDFFNNYFADGDGDEEDTPKEEAKKPAKKGAKKKETSKKKTETKKTSKKDKNASKKTDKKTKEKDGKAGKEKKKDTKTEIKAKSAVGVKKPSVAKRNALITKLIETGKWTKKQIVNKVVAKFTDVTESTISTSVQDSMNLRYNKLEKLTIKDAKTGKLSFED